jgi:IS30 family transposase
LPKGTELSAYTQDDLDAIAYRLNSRPRKVLGFRTPREVFDELLKATLLNAANVALGG